MANSIEVIEKRVKQLVTDECQDAYLTWRSKIISYTKSIESSAPGLSLRVKHFTESHRASFFKNFQKKVSEKLEIVINNALKDVSQTNIKSLTRRMPLEKAVEREKLEAYLIHEKSVIKAAEYLGIKRTTFQTWVSKNKELIIAEERKTL